MNSAADFLVRQQASAAESQFRSWGQQVVRMHKLDDAVRTAAHKPTPGVLVRSMPVLWKSAKTQAETAIERHLAGLIEKADAATLMRVERGLQGHWPKLYTQAHARIRLLSQG
jgi:hypothetical protein